MSLMTNLRSKLELFRLERRYTARRSRRSTFISDAQYVDGEYIIGPNTGPRKTAVAGRRRAGTRGGLRGVLRVL
ncbi:MAG: hypothetical protein M1832_003146 [Thelocarpon impressellum]|nr:MAG: hypothetical protein M1832_003146 [Thelocarpon impressellum]